MTGYCSNSPLRCTNAHDMIMLTEASNYCPKCGLALVPANDSVNSSYAEQRFLSIGLVVIALLLLVLVYAYYSHQR